jgi:hypothetical protein
MKNILYVGNRSQHIPTYIALSFRKTSIQGFLVTFGQFLRKRDNLLTGEWGEGGASAGIFIQTMVTRNRVE